LSRWFAFSGHQTGSGKAGLCRCPLDAAGKLTGRPKQAEEYADAFWGQNPGVNIAHTLSFKGIKINNLGLTIKIGNVLFKKVVGCL